MAKPEKTPKIGKRKWGLQYAWEEIRKQGRTIKCYILASDQKMISVFDNVCKRLGVEFQHLPLDIKLLSSTLAEHIDIVGKDGFVVIALDIGGLGKRALELRNLWRASDATIGIPFLYLMDKTSLPREYDPLHGYEELRRFSGESFDIEAGIKTVVVRERHYRDRVKGRPTPGAGDSACAGG